MRLAPILVLSLLAPGCRSGSSAASDAAIYADVLAHAGQDPEAEIARCLGLADSELRAECAEVVAVAAARAGGDAAAWCARVPDGKWHDECMFSGADAALPSSGTGAAAALCQQAGAYQADCVTHVWKPQLGRLTNGMTPADFGARYAAADMVFRAMVNAVGWSTYLERSYWLSYFGTGFHAAGRVETASCEGLAPEARQRCLAAAALLLTEPLEGLLRQSGQLARFCAMSPPSSAEVAPLLGVAPSSELDEALAAEQPMLCGGGRPALGGGLRTSPMGMDNR